MTKAELNLMYNILVYIKERMDETGCTIDDIIEEVGEQIETHQEERSSM